MVLAKEKYGDVTPKAKRARPPIRPAQATMRPELTTVVGSNRRPRRPAITPPRLKSALIVPT